MPSISKKRGYIAIFLAFPFGEGVNGVDERGHKKVLSKFIKKVRPLSS